MNHVDGFTDDDGQAWEFEWREELHYKSDEDDKPVAEPSTIHDFRYRKEGEPEWLALPAWATIRDEWKITLTMFDEDDETGDLTYWIVEPEPVTAKP